MHGLGSFIYHAQLSKCRQLTSAKHGVLSIQPGSDDSGDEELTAIGIWSSVGHTQQASNIMLQVKVLILHHQSIVRAMLDLAETMHTADEV